MARLPISRVVDVTVTRADRFPTRAGFGVPLILTSKTGAVVNPTTLTRVYGSMEEVASDWGPTDEAYKAANVIFSQGVRPPTIKIGFVPETVVGAGSTDWADAMDDLYDYDSNWYWLVPGREFRDHSSLDDLIAWVESKRVIMFLDSNDPATEDRNDLTSVAARNKGGPYDRTSVYYHPDPNMYFAAAAVGYAATRNFDQADTAYTLKFKPGRTLQPANMPSWAVQGVTGFIPALGLVETEGHFANVYVDIGGIDMIKEGTVLSGTFVDVIHASDWLIARTQEAVLAALTNNARIPYTDPGVQILVAACESVMQRAAIAGLIADIVDPDTGELLPDFEFEVERVSAIPAAQRAQRIAPDIRGIFRFAGAIHFVTVRYTMQF